MVGCIITPTRGDRPEFLERCKRMVAYQTLQLDHIICDYAPKSNNNDIAERYKWLFNEAFVVRKYDYAIIFEDDDYYLPNYCEVMAAWYKRTKAPLIGSSYTSYINLNTLQYKNMAHPNRSSMFHMLVTPAVLELPLSDSAFIDLEISKMKGAHFITQTLALGIKHGKGLTVGAGHKPTFKWDGRMTKEHFNLLTNNFYNE